jgi:DNA repair protein RecN (Recombination protein N)
MITFLHIRNFVIVESLDLELQNGFSALTGETGAGKSILIDALQLLFGARADSSVIRPGENKCDLSVAFSTNEKIQTWLLEEDLAEDGGDIVLRRVIDQSGRSRSWINGNLVPLSKLKELSKLLVMIHGQHAHQSLMHKGSQLQLLDMYAQAEDLTEEVKKAWTALSEARKNLEKIHSEELNRRQEQEKIEWFLENVGELEPLEGEWEQINAEHTKLSSYTDILEACERARVSLTEDDGAALSLVDHSISSLEDVTGADPDLLPVVSSLIDARELIDEASITLERHLSRLDFDEDRFHTLDDRISAYLSAARRHRLEPENLYSEFIKAKKRLDELFEFSNTEKREEEVRQAEAVYKAAALRLSEKRHEAAKLMAKEVSQTMQTLSMPGGRFEVQFYPSAEDASYGLESCEFLVAGHSGVELRPLAKIASGGELARISLAIAVTNRASSDVDTLIFDEVDTGVGGAVAEVIGELLASLGEHQQVLCVTHLPQVASCAHHQLKIVKTQGASDTLPKSTVIPLDKTARVEEIARMLGGIRITDLTLRHARELLDKPKAAG